jgi:hypothetical protein
VSPFVAPIAQYIVRAALAIAAYEDPSGFAAVAMLFDIAILPVVWKVNEYREAIDEFRRKLLEGQDPRTFRAISAAVTEMLGRPIQVPIPKAEPTGATVYEWAFKNARDVVRIMMDLNDRHPLDHTPIQSICFALEKTEMVRMGPCDEWEEYDE